MLLRQVAKRMAKVRAQKTAYVFDGRSWTWSQIANSPAAWRARFASSALAREIAVGIVAQDRIEMIAHRMGREVRRRARRPQLAICAEGNGVHCRRRRSEDGRHSRRICRQVRRRPSRDGSARAAFSSDSAISTALTLTSTNFLRAIARRPRSRFSRQTALSRCRIHRAGTGVPKGAVLTQVGAWIQIMSSPYAGGFRTEDVILNNLPGSGFPIFIHTMGMSSGATTVLPGLFSPAAAVEAALAHGVTIMFCVPALLNAIGSTARRQEYGFRPCD